MQVLVRALDVLSNVCESGTGRSLTTISVELGLPLSTVHRLLRVLAEQGFVAHDPVSGRYFAGPRAMQLVGPAPGYRPLIGAAMEVLYGLRDEYSETVFLTELVGHRAVCVALVESDRPLRLTVGIGHQMPLHATASARTLLAHRPEAEVRGLLGTTALTLFTSDTLDTTDKVIEHLAEVRQRGYDVCDNEFDDDVWAVAAPVRSGASGVVASVTLAAPGARCATAAARKRFIKAVRHAATEIGARLDAPSS